MYFLQVIIVKIFYSFSERIKNSRPSPCYT